MKFLVFVHLTVLTMFYEITSVPYPFTFSSSVARVSSRASQIRSCSRENKASNCYQISLSMGGDRRAGELEQCQEEPWCGSLGGCTSDPPPPPVGYYQAQVAAGSDWLGQGSPSEPPVASMEPVPSSSSKEVKNPQHVSVVSVIRLDAME